MMLDAVPEDFQSEDTKRFHIDMQDIRGTLLRNWTYVAIAATGVWHTLMAISIMFS